MKLLMNNKHVWRSAWAAFVPLALMATVLLGSLSTSSAARRPRSGAKESSADSKATASSKGRPQKAGAYDPSHETVEMFDAMEAGQIEVKLIPKDSTQARVFVKNKTNKPLNVKLPEAFAARPVLAQIGGGGGGQGVGGGMGGMGGGGMGGMGGGFFNVPGLGNGGFVNAPGMGGGFFNVPAEKEGNFKVPCMCLEHGKPEPRPAMAYKIEPIESFTTKPGVAELCRMLGYGKISQRAAQAAAWHLANDMSWETLFAKRIEHLDGSSEPYFTREELESGVGLANQALEAWTSQKSDDKKGKPVASPGETAASLGESTPKSEEKTR